MSNEDFNEVVGEDLRGEMSALESATGLAALQETMNANLGPFLDTIITFAAARRMKMAVHGFDARDQNLMFQTILEQLWPDQNNSSVNLVTMISEMMEDTEDD